MENREQKVRDTGHRERRPAVIRNKDIPLLSNILFIMQEICQIERQREWQNDRRYNITQHITGMPSAKGLPKGLDEALALLEELDDEQRDKCAEYAQQLREAQRLLNGIKSPSMRAFVLMKYVMDVPDVEIRNQLNLSRRAFDQARRCIEQAHSMDVVQWTERYIVVAEDKK